MLAYSYYESDPRVIREAEAAVAGGYEVDFLALRKPGTAIEENLRGVHVLRLNQTKYRGGGHLVYALSYLRFFVACFWKSTHLYFARRYAAVHVNNMPDFLVFSAIVPKLFGAKVLLDIHDPMPNTFASKFRTQDGGILYRLLLWQELLSARFCDKVLTVHEPVKSGILLQHGLRAESIEVISNFPDNGIFALRQTYEIPDRIRIVFHGTIVERSGLKILVDALALVKKKHRIAAKIIGEGDFSGRLKKLIADHGLSEVVEFDERMYPVRSLPPLLEDCHVGVVPLEISSATNYALPLKLIEYVSMGLPVVSVRSAAICYYFREEDCIFFNPNDPASLAAALDHLIENPHLLMTYRERSVALRSKFLWSTERARYIALLHQLTAHEATSTQACEQ
jgi:glycosyltransferase involved in cell wall biosynthesis